MTPSACRLAALALCLIPASAAIAQAPAAKAIKVQLNRMEPAEQGCLATVVTENGAGERLTSFKLDLVVFDRDGIVAKRIAAELGPLAAGKTVVKTFPIAGLACEAVEWLLVNEAVACTTAAGPLEGCVEALDLSSRAAARFTK